MISFDFYFSVNLFGSIFFISINSLNDKPYDFLKGCWVWDETSYGPLYKSDYGVWTGLVSVDSRGKI